MTRLRSYSNVMHWVQVQDDDGGWVTLEGFSDVDLDAVRQNVVTLRGLAQTVRVVKETTSTEMELLDV